LSGNKWLSICLFHSSLSRMVLSQKTAYHSLHRNHYRVHVLMSSAGRAVDTEQCTWNMIT
jgi:hypothetical protein